MNRSLLHILSALSLLVTALSCGKEAPEAAPAVEPGNRVRFSVLSTKAGLEADFDTMNAIGVNLQGSSSNLKVVPAGAGFWEPETPTEWPASAVQVAAWAPQSLTSAAGVITYTLADDPSAQQPFYTALATRTVGQGSVVLPFAPALSAIRLATAKTHASLAITKMELKVALRGGGNLKTSGKYNIFTGEWTDLSGTATEKIYTIENPFSGATTPETILNADKCFFLIPQTGLSLAYRINSDSDEDWLHFEAHDTDETGCTLKPGQVLNVYIDNPSKAFGISFRDGGGEILLSNPDKKTFRYYSSVSEKWVSTADDLIAITMPHHGSVRFVAELSTLEGCHFSLSKASASTRITVDGDPSCLLSGSAAASLPQNAFKGLFRDNPSISGADLTIPFASLSEGCFQEMFKGCGFINASIRFTQSVSNIPQTASSPGFSAFADFVDADSYIRLNCVTSDKGGMETYFDALSAEYGFYYEF